MDGYELYAVGATIVLAVVAVLFLSRPKKRGDTAPPASGDVRDRGDDRRPMP